MGAGVADHGRARTRSAAPRPRAPDRGADRVRVALTETAALLEYLHTETIKMMNEGARLDEIVHTVTAPTNLLAQPFLRPIYDEPEFVVRNVWRLFGGWYDGNPAHLKPAPEAALAGELADLTGGARTLAARGSRSPTTASCASPVISRSSPRSRRPTTPSCTEPGRT